MPGGNHHFLRLRGKNQDDFFRTKLQQLLGFPVVILLHGFKIFHVGFGIHFNHYFWRNRGVFRFILTSQRSRFVNGDVAGTSVAFLEQYAKFVA